MQLDENRAIRDLRIGKKKIKLSVLVDDMIIYILKISESKRKLLYVIRLFSLKKNLRKKQVTKSFIYSYVQIQTSYKI